MHPSDLAIKLDRFKRSSSGPALRDFVDRMPGFKLKQRRLPSRRYPFVPFAPSIHFANLAQAILYRGLVFFTVVLVRLRRAAAVS